MPFGLFSNTCMPMAVASSSPATTATTAKPRRSSSSSAHPTLQSKTALTNGRAHDHGRSPAHAERSCATKVSLGENDGHRGVSTQLPAKQDHMHRHAVLQGVRQTRQPFLPANYWDPSTWEPSSASCATFAAHPISTPPTVATTTSSSLASETLHTAPVTRRRQGLHY